MVNFQKINKHKIIWCPICDTPIDYKNKKCSNCGYIISNKPKFKKNYKPLDDYKLSKGF